MKSCLVLFTLSIVSMAANATSYSEVPGPLLGSTPAFIKHYNTTAEILVDCADIDTIQIMPRRAPRTYYENGAIFWLKKIEYVYADGTTQTYDSGFGLDRVIYYAANRYQVPKATTCLTKIQVTGRNNCRIGAYSCASNSEVLDIYEVNP